MHKLTKPKQVSHLSTPQCIPIIRLSLNPNLSRPNPLAVSEPSSLTYIVEKHCWSSCATLPSPALSRSIQNGIPTTHTGNVYFRLVQIERDQKKKRISCHGEISNRSSTRGRLGQNSEVVALMRLMTIKVKQPFLGPICSQIPPNFRSTYARINCHLTGKWQQVRMSENID